MSARSKIAAVGVVSLLAILLAAPGMAATAGDYDGDGKADIAVWRPSTGTWFIIPSSTPTSFRIQQWGTFGDIPVPGDYDGDGKTDFAVWRPSTGTWFIIPSSNPSSPIVRQWGTAGDIPVPGDYDGDGKTDIAVWRPSSGTWFIVPSSTPSSPIVQQWGTVGDIAVPGDYDGDGKTDIAVWRPSAGTWFIIPSSSPSAPIIRQWGTAGDIPVPGDYDGDKKTDIAIWRPSIGTWFIMPSSNPSFPIVRQWGTAGDIPVPKDYDGDGKTDIAVWRPSSGTWFVIPSSAPSTFTITQWGISTDIPVQKPITTSNNSMLMGNYAFLFNGWNSQGLFVVAGDFVADGNGNISNGLADINDTTGPVLNQSFTGTYSIASDNLGTVTLNLGGGGTLAIAVQAGGDAKVIEFDDTTGTGTRGSGVFKKQDTTAFSTAKITGHYAFGTVGVDSTGKRFAVGGVFQADGAGNITNGLLDGNDGGALLSSATFTGPYSVAASGRGTFSPTITGQGTSNFSFYVVSATEALIMQIDSIPSGKSLTSGSVLQQAGGGSFTNASLSGTSVVETGSLSSGTPATEVGLAMTDGVSTLTFAFDHNLGGTITTESGTLTYAVASNGRVTLTGTTGPPVFYLVSQNKGFVISTNNNVGFGFVENQSAGPFSSSSISGTYAGGSITPVDSNVSDEVDEFVVPSAGNFNNTSDNSSGGGLTSNKMQSGTYSVAANGRTTGTVPGMTGMVILYIVSPTKVVGFATDPNPKLLVFEQ